MNLIDTIKRCNGFIENISDTFNPTIINIVNEKIQSEYLIIAIFNSIIWNKIQNCRWMELVVPLWDIYLIIINSVSDIGGYVFGNILKGPKIFPNIMPFSCSFSIATKIMSPTIQYKFIMPPKKSNPIRNQQHPTQ